MFNTGVGGGHPLRITVIRYYVRVINKIFQVIPAYHGTYFIISAGHIIVCIYGATIIRGWFLQ